MCQKVECNFPVSLHSQKKKKLPKKSLQQEQKASNEDVLNCFHWFLLKAFSETEDFVSKHGLSLNYFSKKLPFSERNVSFLNTETM